MQKIKGDISYIKSRFRLMNQVKITLVNHFAYILNVLKFIGELKPD